MKFIKVIQATLPGEAGIGRVSIALLGISAMQKGFSLAETFTQLPGELEGALIATGSFCIPAETIIDIAEAIPCLGFGPEVAELVLQD
jgi:hypothetical protein